MIPALLAFLSLAPEPVNLDSIAVERACHLSGRVVVATFLNAHEPYAYPEFAITTIGPANRDDGAERVAVLKGVRYDLKAGERVRVGGVLEVIDHEPAFVGAVLVPAWAEIRVTEVRR